MPYTLDDIQAVAPRVLERLNALAPLPSKGTVAGQAVASVVLEELGHAVRGPINDIDVFVNLQLPRTQRGLPNLPPNQTGSYYTGQGRTQKTTSHMGNVGVESDYEHVKFIALRSTTTVVRTYQVGLVNYTLIQSPYIKFGEHGHGKMVSQSLVDGFDLNLVGVGINLETGEAVATPGFLEFLNTSTIRVETANTPAHTLVRLAKKVFGGEIQGAVCHYEQERALLEAALDYQERVAHADEYTLGSILKFGSGKYKALHQRFSQHLPPLKETLVTYHDESSYSFYSFDLPPSPKDNAFFEALLPLKAEEGPKFHISLTPGAPLVITPAPEEEKPPLLSHALAHQLYIAQFPRVYELFHPERALDSAEEIERRRQFVEQIRIENNDAKNLRLLQRSMGQVPIELDLPSLDEEDAFAFFHNQHCATDPALAAQARDGWMALTPLDRHVLYHLDQRADMALALSMDREGIWKHLLSQMGLRVMRILWSASDDKEHAQAMLMQCWDWLGEMGGRGERLRHDIVPLFMDTPTYEAGGKEDHWQGVLSGFEGSAREELAERWVKDIAPSWPTLQDEPVMVRSRALCLWTGQKMNLPTAFWDALQVEDIPAHLKAVLEMRSNNSYTWLGTGNEKGEPQEGLTRCVLDRLVSKLDLHTTLSNEAQVLHMLCKEHQTQPLQILVNRFGAEPFFQQSFGQVLEDLRQEQGETELLLGLNSFGPLGGQSKNAEKMAELEKILLDCASAPGSTSTAPRRRF